MGGGGGGGHVQRLTIGAVGGHALRLLLVTSETLLNQDSLPPVRSHFTSQVLAKKRAGPKVALLFLCLFVCASALIMCVIL